MSTWIFMQLLVVFLAVLSAVSCLREVSVPPTFNFPDDVPKTIGTEPFCSSGCTCDHMLLRESDYENDTDLHVYFLVLYVKEQIHKCKKERENRDECFSDIVKAVDTAMTRGSSNIPLALAHFAKGSLYEIGILVPENEDVEKSVFRHYLQSAKLGFELAQLAVGEFYRFGRGCKTDLNLSLHYYKLSSRNGNNLATYRLAWLYINGDFADREAVGIRMMLKLAREGYDKAQTHIGKLLEDGEIRIDSHIEIGREAVNWYRRAAKQGDTEAYFRLGKCYKRGYGVEKDDKIAADLFKTGAEKDDVNCMIALGEHFMNGDPDECWKAARWFKAAAGMGSAVGMHSYGRFFEYCEERRNLTKAVKWYVRAAKEQYPQAYADLARCYSNGIGVEKNDVLTRLLSEKHEQLLKEEESDHEKKGLTPPIQAQGIYVIAEQSESECPEELDSYNPDSYLLYSLIALASGMATYGEVSQSSSQMEQATQSLLNLKRMELGLDSDEEW